MRLKTAQARRLRKASTRSAHRLAMARDVIGPFILDFYSASLKLAIEIDGASHFDEDQRLYDHRRDRYLVQHGVAVVRVSDDLVRNEPTAAADQIVAAVRLRQR